METSTLTYIVKRAQKGDIDARQTLYLDSAKSVYYLALKILKNPEDAEDITQDVFIVVYDKIADLKEPAAFYKWLNQITANRCMSFLRKKKPMLGDEQDLLEILEPEEDDISLMPDKAYDDAETRRIIMEIIDQLPDAQRVVIMYRYFSQLSIDEIAEMTATNVHTVKSRLALARQKIREAILEKEEKDGIRLHVLIPITPILQKALEEFTMPEGVSEAMWQNIAQAISAPTAANGGQSSPSTGAESGAAAEAASAATAAGTTGAAAGGTAAGMALITKIIIGVAAVAVIAAGAVFLPRIINPDDTNTPSGQVENSDTRGHYDGDLVDGVRSGYGTWVYGSYYYEGYFENDKPNGEGRMISAHALPENPEQGASYGIQYALIGNFVDGFADGPMTYIHYANLGYTITWEVEFVMGELQQDGEIPATNGVSKMPIRNTTMLGGIPPWADVHLREGVTADPNLDGPDYVDWSGTHMQGRPQVDTDPEPKTVAFSFAQDEPLPATSLILDRSNPVGAYGGRFYTLDLEGDIALESRALDGSDVLNYPDMKFSAYDFDRITIVDGYLYYREYDRTTITSTFYRIAADGGERTELFEIPGNMEIRFIDRGHIYYTLRSGDNLTMCRVGLDGQAVETLWQRQNLMQTYRFLESTEEYLLCQHQSALSSDGEVKRIFTLNISTGAENTLTEAGNFLALIDDYVYYSTKEGDAGDSLYYKLHRVRLDGSGYQPLLNDDEGLIGGTSRIHFGRDAIYCAVTQYPPDAIGIDSKRIDIATYRLELDGSDRIRLMNDFVAGLAVSSGEDDLFLGDDARDQIGKLEAESSRVIWFEDTKGARSLLFVEDGWIYYYKYSDNTAAYSRVRTDGTGNMKLFSYTF